MLSIKVSVEWTFSGGTGFIKNMKVKVLWG